MLNHSKIKLIVICTLMCGLIQVAELKKLTIKGVDVKLSDLIAHAEYPKADHIEIFALNKVVFDADIEKRNLTNGQLVIVAPTWEIITDKNESFRNIWMIGANGEQHKILKADDGDSNDPNGKDGLQGNPGFAGGNIFGVGNNFINAERLNIHLNGGNGSDGQSGGKGVDGVNGTIAPFQTSKMVDAIKIWQSMGLKVGEDYKQVKYERAGGRTYATYEIIGSKGKMPGNGGNGGKSGPGGYSGQISIFEFNGRSKHNLFANEGLLGNYGQGSAGGQGSHDGEKITVDFTITSESLNVVDGMNQKYTSAIKGFNTTTTYDKGIDGKSNYIDSGFKPIQNNFTQIAASINGFKKYARDSIANGHNRTILATFLDHIENTDDINAHYDVIDFVNELKDMKIHYLRMGRQFPFKTWLDSMLIRIEKFARKLPEADEKKKVLALVYTAILSKRHTINENVRTTKIIMRVFLDRAIESIHKREKWSWIDSRYEFEDTLKRLTKIRIDDMRVHNDTKNEIEKSLQNIEIKISQIVDTIIKTSPSEMISTSKAELAKAIILRSGLVSLKSANAILTMSRSLSDTVFKHGLGTSILDKLPDDIIWIIDDLFKNIKDGINLTFSRQEFVLNKTNSAIDIFVDGLINDQFNPKTPEFIEEIIILKKDINDIYEKKSVCSYVAVSDESTSLLYEKEELLQKKIEAEEKRKRLFAYAESDPSNKTAKWQSYQTMQRAKSVLYEGLIAWNFYENLSQNQSKLEVFNNEVTQIIDQLQEPRTFESNIFTCFASMTHELKKGAAKDSHGLSHDLFDSNKWKVQTCVKKMEEDLNKISKHMPFELGDEYRNSFDDVDSIISFLITMYGHIEHYRDFVNLDAYITAIESISENNIRDPILRKEVAELKSIVDMDFYILRHFEDASKLFRRHQFPFAHDIFKIDLPDNLYPTEPALLSQYAEDKINEMINWRLSWKYNSANNSDIDFGNNPSNNSFYVWKHIEIKHKLKKFFSGEKITVKTHIGNGLSFNAVKFNELGIYLKLANKSRQAEFNSTIEHFKLNIEPKGSAYHRCGNKFYYMPGNDGLSMNYLMVKDPVTHKYEHSNMVVDKIQQTTFLSPYTTWILQLYKSFNEWKRDFNVFDSFVDEVIDLELVGHGSYFAQSKKFTDGVCTGDLDKYYSLDESISN